MEENRKNVHETVEDKAAKAKDEVKSKDETKAEVEKTEEKEAASKEDSRKEGLNDSDMIDINKEESEKASSSASKTTHGVGGKNAPKTTSDFIAKQKKRKKTRRIVILLIVAIVIFAIVMWVKNTMNKAKEAFAGLAANNVQTAFVEKKTLYDSKDATGTLYALESRTISRVLTGTGQKGADIAAVNVEVGDHVVAGDVLVEFSSEDIEESIARKKEDIGTQKKLDAITTEDAQREYVYQYSNASTSLQNTAQSVDRALEALYEACDGYGQAKRERDEIKNLTNDEYAAKFHLMDNSDDTVSRDRESRLKSAEASVAAAYEKQKAAQRTYDDAVAAQASGQGGVASVQNSLSAADSTYKKSQLQAGNNVKELQRSLNDAIDSLDDYVVHATISGVVTEVNVSEGNTFTSGNVLTIQDDSGYKAEVLVDEYDIPKVKKAYEEKKANGQYLEVVVKTDATGDNEYKGHVTLISPTSTSTTTGGASSSSGSSSAAASSSSSTVNYKVSIVLDEIDDAFMIGMSAKVAIVVSQSPENALCVPYNCIQETEDGKFIVKVMDEHGDKSTADDMIPNMGPGNANRKGNGSDSNDFMSKGVNGIVVENNSEETDDASNNKKKGGRLSKLLGKDNKNAEIEAGRRYREVEVDKIFDTDYYAAVIPKAEGSLKEGDEVMIVTEKANGNDIMAMFGGPGGF